MIDQIDWDGALTHRVGKIHDVGIYNLRREKDGTLTRHATPLAGRFAKIVRSGEAVGKLNRLSIPYVQEDQGLPIESESSIGRLTPSIPQTARGPGGRSNGAGKNLPSSAPVSAAAPIPADTEVKQTDRYGIVVFSHLRWGFVWQRPQQFLSRFARKHKILFVEEPFFNLPAGAEPRLDFHKVMPNVTVICPRLSPAWRTNRQLPSLLRNLTRDGIKALNDGGEFDRPLLWYYSPMDSAWSLGHIPNRGIVYDCMDELSQFTGAPKSLVENEARLMQFADIVFTGGYELAGKKRAQHSNVHPFGCGVDFEHFAKASIAATPIPPDIDFMQRPILGWFGVVDERVDYPLLAEMARLRPGWSFAMVGPVVKIDPNLLPHAPNLYWLGGRDYQQLPNYCRAFDVNMMCFAINAATQFINPTKGLEYMATGKPVVSTPVRDVVRQWAEVVRIARTADEFIAAAEEALAAGPNDECVRRGIELARKSGWESTVESMQKLIRDAISSPARQSARPIEPPGEGNIEFAYAATQGS
jgi:glycosyltransferase involved in cell wall biosynthesis